MPEATLTARTLIGGMRPGAVTFDRSMTFSDSAGRPWVSFASVGVLDADNAVVVDTITGRGHIAARREQIALFARMIKTR